MIITQAPLRISFLGGGTDFPDFFAAEPGCVLSATIDKFIFVILKRRFDRFIRVGYTRTERAEHVRAIEHDLVREAMRLTGVAPGIEIATMADIPSEGSGLGSSSAVTVALLHALWSYLGHLPSREQLAAAACAVEIDRLRRPIGVQDQYAAAYGGLRFMTFEGDRVTVEPVGLEGALDRRLGERLLLFFTGRVRQSADILAEQKANIERRRPTLRAMAELARQGRAAIEAGELDGLGELMDEGWRLKRALASRITDGELDALYETARRAGAIGGKLTGAGGGGFLLLYCRPEHQPAVRAALHGLQELEFNLTAEGTLVLLHQRGR